MAVYATKYICEFDSADISPQPYKFEILEKNFTGNAQRLIGTATPVLHKYSTDDPKAPIKGSSLEFNYINEGSYPISLFYAPEDDTFKGRLYWSSTLIFEGYLVQDDCYEILTDARHPIKLAFNDNLGLLKDVKLDAAYKPGYNDLQTTTESTTGKKTVLDIIKHCIYCTGLQLPTNVYSELSIVGQTTEMLKYAMLNIESFLLSESEWDSCYNVLTKILETFEMSLFQANGQWNIVRWSELKYATNNRITGIQYSADFTTSNNITLDLAMDLGINEDLKFQYGAGSSIVRHFKYAKRTFNYKNPIELLKNPNLKRVGALLRQYTTGSGVNLQTIYEYAKVDWADGFEWTSGGGGIIPISTYAGDSFIRVTNDYVGRELDRILVVKSNATNSIICVAAPIELSKDDVVEFSFNHRTKDSQPGFTRVQYKIAISKVLLPITPRPNSSNLLYLNKDASTGLSYWSATTGYPIEVQTGDDWQTYHTDTITMAQLPFDGFLYIFLAQTQSSGGETWYKDFNLTVTYKINQSTRVIGQIHTQEQTPAIKLNEDKEINIDDSPRNSISGTLFKNTGATYGVKTDFWSRAYSFSEAKRLGEIIVFEKLFWNRRPRVKIEGSIKNLVSNNKIFSLISVLNYKQMPNLLFVIGSAEIDYRNNEVKNCTLYEAMEFGETDALLTSNYSFVYKYES